MQNINLAISEKIIESFMKRVVDLTLENIDKTKGGPFAAIIARGEMELGTGVNAVVPDSDPTAHAEMLAIGNACRKLKTVDLSGCVLYASCEPCPMCLGACQWGRIRTVYYALNRWDAQKMGFDDVKFYEMFEKQSSSDLITTQQVKIPEADEIIKRWLSKSDRHRY